MCEIFADYRTTKSETSEKIVIDSSLNEHSNALFSDTVMRSYYAYPVLLGYLFPYCFRVELEKYQFTKL